MPVLTVSAHRARSCALCGRPLTGHGFICLTCVHERADAEWRLLEHVRRAPRASLEELERVSGLEGAAILEVAGDQRSEWDPPQREEVPRCGICSAPTGQESGTCRSCARRLEGRAPLAARR